MQALKLIWQQLVQYDQMAGISEIARRYFAMNAFDGVLTMIGVLMGTMTAGVTDPQIVLTTGLTTSMAMGISGLWGAYLTETAERRRKLSRLSRQTLTELSGTRLGRASRLAIVIVALVDGLSPLLAALLVLTPFLLIQWLPDITWAYYAALGMALLTLFAIGLFLGRVSRENVFLFGIKTVIAGFASILISTLLKRSG